MRVRPGITVLWRGPTQVQVGTDPRWAVTLGRLTPPAARALAGLAGGADVRVIHARLRAEGVDPEEGRAVVALLRSVNLLTGRAPDPPASHDHVAWSLLDTTGTATALLGRRSRAHVRVVGLGRLGAGIAAALASAGVGMVEPVDDGPVTSADVGATGLRPRDVGTRRDAAVRRLLHELAPHVRTGAGRADLVVLVEQHVADPRRHLGLMADDVPHLAVVAREASVSVGPLVRPGDGPCLRCVELHRGDADDGWPAVAAQLAGAARPVVGGEETTLAAAAVGFAVAQCLAAVDGRPATTDGASVELRLPDLMPVVTSWAPHPDCGCAGPVERARPTRAVPVAGR
ncbi:ThiF family adenylyltransferase [Actinotalea sp. AC32]|nr:ThiF family adenylyltransferase [Actinotalea sp. AC32]